MIKKLSILCLITMLILGGCGSISTATVSQTSVPSTPVSENPIEDKNTANPDTDTVNVQNNIADSQSDPSMSEDLPGTDTETLLPDTSQEPETEPGPEIPDTWYVSPKNTGALQVKNGTLCSQDGTPVQLKGVSTHAVTRVEPFLNQDLFYEMRTQWGVNVVRLAMYTLGQDGYTKSDYFREKNIELVKKGIELAAANDLYAIVDWHVLDDKNPLNFLKEAREFFGMISQEYGDRNHIIYEICNEPNNTDWSDIKAYANEIIPVIRTNAPGAVIICGTPDWSQGVDQALADPLEFDNLMYTLHFYSATHKDELRDRMVKCSQAGLPVFVTEYGVTHSSGGFPRDLEEADRWMAAIDQNNISSCIWCLAKNGEPCCLVASGAQGYSGYEGEDFNETGEWFTGMMKLYKESIEKQ